MKKLIYLALVLAVSVGFTSCEETNDDDDQIIVDPTVLFTDYLGDLDVSYMGTSMSAQSDVSYSTSTEEGSGFMDITLNSVCFMPTTGMPSLDIVLPNLELQSDGTYTADSVVPTALDGEPYDTSVLVGIDNVVATIVDDTITVTFDCSVSTTYMGDLTCQVTYEGVAQ
ncbi:MAG: hypothetical protein R3Y39_00920 [Rikenellaceae bacterium]